MKQALLHRLTDQPSALDHLLAGHTEEQIRQRPQTGKWSILENLAHLARYQDIFLERIQQICQAEMPLFSPYVADDDPGFASWTQLSSTSVREKMANRRYMLNNFLRYLDDQQLIRIGLHAVYGPMTIEGWTEFFLLHEAHHFFTILKLGGASRNNGQPMG